jgi:hypothetical protein
MFAHYLHHHNAEKTQGVLWRNGAGQKNNSLGGIRQSSFSVEKKKKITLKKTLVMRNIRKIRV